MIDLHTHILFGVDDGCKNVDESISLIKKAVKNGISNIFLTPHYNPFDTKSATADKIINNFKVLQKEITKKKIPCNIYLGREIYGSRNIVELLKEDLTKSMAYSKYVLIDFGLEATDIDEFCYHLILKGYIPIIAHPERYNYIDDVELYKKWRQTGALIQVNAESFFHRTKRNIYKSAHYLLKNNLVDFIASDTHRDDVTLKYFNKIYHKMNHKNEVSIRHNAQKVLDSISFGLSVESRLEQIKELIQERNPEKVQLYLDSIQLYIESLDRRDIAHEFNEVHDVLNKHYISLLEELDEEMSCVMVH